MLSLFALLRRTAESTPFPSILSSRNLFTQEKFNCHQPLWDSKDTFDSRGKYSIGSSPLISFLLMTPAPNSSPSLLRKSLLRKSLLFRHLLCFLLSCSRKVPPYLGSDLLLILLAVPLFLLLSSNESSLSFNFQKARWDGFTFYFDWHCPFEEKYSSLSHSSATALFTSLALNTAKFFYSF